MRQVTATILGRTLLESEDLPAGVKSLARWESGGSGAWYAALARYRRHDHGGGDSGDDWLDDHEISQDFEMGAKRFGSLLDRVNKELAAAGYEPNAQFDLGEKGHFEIVLVLTPSKKAKAPAKAKAAPKAKSAVPSSPNVETDLFRYYGHIGVFSATLANGSYAIDTPKGDVTLPRDRILGPRPIDASDIRELTNVYGAEVAKDYHVGKGWTWNN